MSTRVLIVDDHAMFRAGVRAELGTSATTSTRLSRRSCSTGPTSYSSTCTCPAAEEPR